MIPCRYIIICHLFFFCFFFNLFCSLPFLSFFFPRCICAKIHTLLVLFCLFSFRGYGGDKRVFMQLRQGVAQFYICISSSFHWRLLCFDQCYSISKWSTCCEVYEIFSCSTHSFKLHSFFSSSVSHPSIPKLYLRLEIMYNKVPGCVLPSDLIRQQPGQQSGSIPKWQNQR